MSLAPVQDILETMNALRTLVVVEPNYAGHHFYFVSLMLRHFRDNHSDYNVQLLTTPEAISSPEYKMHLSGYPLSVSSSDHRPKNLRYLQSLTVVKEASAVYLPYGDPWLIALWQGKWALQVPCIALVIRCDTQSNRIPGLGLMFATVKKSLMLMASFRRNLSVSGLKSSLQKRCFPIRWIDDPITFDVDEAQLALMKHKMAALKPKIWIGVYGHITWRKNLDLILKVVEGNTDWGLIISGKIDTDVYRDCEDMLTLLLDQHRLVLETGPTSDSQFNANIMASDIVAVAHSNEGPSAVLMKAIHLRRKVLTAGAKSLRKEAKKAGSGVIWARLNATDISEGFEQLTQTVASQQIATKDETNFGRRLCHICL